MAKESQTQKRSLCPLSGQVQVLNLRQMQFETLK